MISATRYQATAEINRQSRLGQDIAKLQESVSSGKRLSSPSDDPAASARIADIRRDQADQLAWTGNIQIGQSIADAADATLGNVATLLDRAKELVLSGRNDATSATDRATIASELRGLAQDIQHYSQTSDATGRPLFPTGAVLEIPVSAELSLPATTGASDVFDSVQTATGTRSIVDILGDAAAALEQATPATLATATDVSITALDAAAGHIAMVRADQGVRAQRFDQAKDRLDTMGTALTTERSALESTDLTYALSEFQIKQLALQAAQSVFAQSHKSTLFDLMG